MVSFNYHTTAKRLLGDLYTPVSLYMRLRDLYPQSMLMESSDYHGNDNAKSFIGIHPMASIQVAHGIITMLFPDGSSIKREVSSENSDALKLAVAKAINGFLNSFHVEGANTMGYLALLPLMRCDILKTYLLRIPRWSAMTPQIFSTFSSRISLYSTISII